MLSVVVPCFNEEEVLPAFFERVVRAAETWSEPIELIFVDDGSTDGTWAWISEFAEQDRRVVGIRLARNFGHQAALGAGMQRATGEALVVLDADLQDPPELVEEMLARWREGYDVVYAQRNRRSGETVMKRLTSHAFYRTLDWFNQVSIPRDTGDFALMDAKVVKTLCEFGEHSLFWRGLRCWSGFRHTAVQFDRPARAAGETKYTLRKMIQLASDGLLSFSRAPLRLPFYLGIAVVFTAMAASGASTVWRFAGGGAAVIPWWVTAVFLLGGVQLICTGVLGEYLARIYDEVRGRPRWIVRDEVAADAPALELFDRPRRIAS